MKNLLKILIVLSILIIPLSLKVKAQSDSKIVIHYFMRDTCPNCKEITKFLNDYMEDYDDIIVIKYDILYEKDSEELFYQVVDVFNRKNPTVPYIVIGGRELSASAIIEAELHNTLEYYRNQDTYVDIIDKILNNEAINDEDLYVETIENQVIKLPIIGEIRIATFSLFLGAVIIGLIDGFNPCAMWILIFLITLLINLKSRKKIWILGLTFILTSGLIYFVIMISWLQLVIRIAMIQAFQIGIGILAIVFSIFSIKHFWDQHRKDTGCEVTNPHKKRKIIERAKRIVHSKNIWLAIIGIMGLAISVNIIELACSAGLPVIYTSMLAYHQVSTSESIMYILIYVFFFIFDDLLIFTIAIITFKITGFSSRFAKYSNLVGGLIMLFIGIALIFFPSILL